MIKYRKQNHKLGISPIVFIMVDVSLILIVTVIYSICANSTVNALERSHRDAQEESRNRSRTLFIGYLCRLIICIVWGITFIALLETHLIFPRHFPSDFSSSIDNQSFNRTQSVNSFNCVNHRAGDKNVWIRVVTATNGIFAFFSFLEILWILSRARNGKKIMENRQFYADHLKLNSDEQCEAKAQETPLVEPQLRPINDP